MYYNIVGPLEVVLYWKRGGVSPSSGTTYKTEWFSWYGEVSVHAPRDLKQAGIITITTEWYGDSERCWEDCGGAGRWQAGYVYKTSVHCPQTWIFLSACPLFCQSLLLHGWMRGSGVCWRHLPTSTSPGGRGRPGPLPNRSAEQEFLPGVGREKFHSCQQGGKPIHQEDNNVDREDNDFTMRTTTPTGVTIIPSWGQPY